MSRKDDIADAANEAPVCAASGKKSFSSKSQAKRAAKVIGLRVRSRLYTYTCPDCGAVHLTKQKQEHKP